MTLVEAIARGENMPDMPPNRVPLSSARRPKIGWWKRVKRSVKRMMKRRQGMRELTFHTLARVGGGWQSVLQFANLENPDFPGRAVDLLARVSIYRPDGSFAKTLSLNVDAGQTLALDVGTELGDLTADGLFLVVVHFEATSPRAARMWRVGSNRPYMTWAHEGFPMTVHEKSLHFDRWCVLPGVLTLPGFEIDLCVANLADAPGTITFRLQADGKTEERILTLAPFASGVWTVPAALDGSAIQQVEAISTIPLTGYQLVRNLRSGLMAIQHLVKEGS